MSEENIVVCMLALDMEGKWTPPQSKRYPCSECGRDVIATPASQRQVLFGGRVVCISCGISLAKAQDIVIEGVELTPGSEKEYAQWIEHQRRN